MKYAGLTGGESTNINRLCERVILSNSGLISKQY